MTLPIALRVTLAALAWLVLVGGLVYGLRQRWFARFENGFFLSMVVALVGVALMAATVVGVWGYLSAEQILEQEIVVELQDVGGVLESEVANDIDDVESQLTGLGGSLADALATHLPQPELRATVFGVKRVARGLPVSSPATGCACGRWRSGS